MIQSTKIGQSECTDQIFTGANPKPELANCPSHFLKMSGPKAKRFQALFAKGILNEYGILTKNYLNQALPPLDKKEIESLAAELEREFEIAIEGENGVKTSWGQILRKLHEDNKKYNFSDLHIVKDYVIYFLFHKTGYAQRVYEQLGVAEAYYKLENQESRYLDLRQKVKTVEAHSGNVVPYSLDSLCLPSNFPKAEDMNDLSLSMLQQVCTLINPTGNKEGLAEKVQMETFDKWHREEGFNRFQCLTFKNSRCALVLDALNQKEAIFNAKALFLPIFDILWEKENPCCCTPEAYGTHPLQAFFECDLGFMRTEYTKSIQSDGWLCYLSEMSAKGYTSMQESSGYQKSLREILFSKITQRDPLQLQELIKNWLNQHHAHEPLIQLFYYINACLFLEREGIKNVSEILLKDIHLLKLEGIASDLRNLITEKKIPLERLLDFVHVASFLMHVRESKINGVSVEIAVEDFKTTITQFRIGNATLHLRGNALDAFKNLALHQKEWIHEEQTLTQLFVQLCPPSQGITGISEEIACSLDVQILKLRDIAFDLAQTDSLLLKYVGIICYSGLHCVNSESKKKLAQVHVWDFLDALENSIPREELRLQLSQIVGEIPETQEEWIRTLFASSSLEAGLFAYKKMLEHEERLQFAIELIVAYTQTQPELALKLYTYIKAKIKTCDPMLRCLNRLQALKEKLSIHHENLIFLLSKDLIQQFHTSPSKEVHGTVETLHWLIKWFNGRNEKKICDALKKGCVGWLPTLFQRGVTEELIAFAEEVSDQEKALDFLVKLINSLVEEHSAVVLRLYKSLKNKNLLGSKGIDVILTCLKCLKQKNVDELSKEEIDLILQCGEDLPNLLKGYKPKGSKANSLANTLQWLLQFLKGRNEAMHKLLTTSCEQLSKKSKDFSQTWLSKQPINNDTYRVSSTELSKQATNKQFSRQKLFFLLLNHFKCEGKRANVTLAEHFKGCIASSEKWEKSKLLEAVNEISAWLQDGTIHQKAVGALLKEIPRFLSVVKKEKSVPLSTFQNLLCISVRAGTLLLQENKDKDLFEVSVKLIKSYSKDLKLVEPDTWLNFFTLAGALNRVDCIFNIYIVLDGNEILVPETNLSVYQKIYGIVVSSLLHAKGAVKEIILLVQDEKKLERIFLTTQEPEIVLLSLGYLLIGGFQYHNEELFSRFKFLYNCFRKLYNIVLDSKKNEIEEAKSCYRLKARIDGVFLDLLLIYRPTALEKFVDRISSSECAKQIEYQKSFFHFICKLCESSKHQHLVDRVLMWLDVSLIDWVQTKTSFNYSLIQFLGLMCKEMPLTPIRALRGLQLWHLDVVTFMQEQRPIFPHSWPTACIFINRLFEINDPQFEDRLGEVLEWMRNYWKFQCQESEEFIKFTAMVKKKFSKPKAIVSMGGVDLIQLLNVDLVYFSLLTRNIYAEARDERIMYVINHFENLFLLPTRDLIIFNLFTAIANSNRFNLDDFNRYNKCLWETIRLKGPETENDNSALFLSPELYFSYKKSFVYKLLAVANSPVHNSIHILEMVRIHVLSLRNEPAFQEWKEEIKFIEEFYQKSILLLIKECSDN